MFKSDNYSNYNSRNIFEYFTPTKALFLCLDALDFMDSKGSPDPKMKIRCCVHDDNLAEGQRITQDISSYIPIGKFLVLTHDILSGNAMKRRRIAEQAGNEYPCYFEHYGGTKKQEIISTKFSLVNGSGMQSSFAFLMTSGPGKTTKTGGIIPIAKSDTQVNDAVCKKIYVALPDEKLKEFCLIGQAYVEQFIALDLQTRLSLVRKQRQSYNNP